MTSANNPLAKTEEERLHLRAFRQRVQRAATIMGQNRPITRSLDNCFENHDGKAVAHALFRLAARNPTGKLAAHIDQYLCGEVNEAARRDGPNMTIEDLDRMSLECFRKRWP